MFLTSAVKKCVTTRNTNELILRRSEEAQKYAMYFRPLTLRNTSNNMNLERINLKHVATLFINVHDLLVISKDVYKYRK